MANIIPPMVSSSPPPLEDGEFEEDDDDEDEHFGDVTDLESSYDLTGLSQILKGGKKIPWSHPRGDDFPHGEANGSVILRESAVETESTAVPETMGVGEKEEEKTSGWTWGQEGVEKELVWVPLRETRIAACDLKEEFGHEEEEEEEESEQFGDFSSFGHGGEMKESCDDGCGVGGTTEQNTAQSVSGEVAEALEIPEAPLERLKDTAIDSLRDSEMVLNAETLEDIGSSQTESMPEQIDSIPVVLEQLAETVETFGDEKVEMTEENEDDEDFGNFSSAEVNESSNFGDFADFSSAEVFSQIEVSEVPAPPWSTASEGHFNLEDFENFEEFESGPTVTQTKVASLVMSLFPSIPAEKSDSSLVYPQGPPRSGTWAHLRDLEATCALTFHWAHSHSQQAFLRALGVDSRNVLFGSRWNPMVPRFAANLSYGPLEPVKATCTSPNSLSATSSSNKEDSHEGCPSPSRTEDGSVPPAQFDWNSSGLVNPLDGGAWSLLDAGLFTSSTDSLASSAALPLGISSLERDAPSAASAIAPPSVPLVPQMAPRPSSSPVGQGSGSSSWTSLGEEAQRFLRRLPDLSFVRSPVLAFPLRSSPDAS